MLGASVSTRNQTHRRDRSILCGWSRSASLAQKQVRDNSIYKANKQSVAIYGQRELVVTWAMSLVTFILPPSLRGRIRQTWRTKRSNVSAATLCSRGDTSSAHAYWEKCS